MNKFFGFGTKKGKSPLASAWSSWRNGRGVGRESNTLDSSQSGYHIRERDLGKLHRAANVGNVAKVQHILWFGSKSLEERDRKHRTALHLACANSEVVTVLLERKCQLHLGDSEIRTALMKAGLTPLLLAINEKKEQMVEFLSGKKAAVYTVNTIER